MHALLYTLLCCLADAVTISPSAEGLSKVYYNKGQCDSKSKVCVTRLAGPRRALSGQTLPPCWPWPALRWPHSSSILVMIMGGFEFCLLRATMLRSTMLRELVPDIRSDIDLFTLIILNIK